MNISRPFLTITAAVIVLLSALIPSYGCNQGSAKFVFQDDFKDPKSGWFVLKADDTKGGKYADGSYQVWATQKNTVVVLNPKTRQEIGDFNVEVTVKQTSDGKGTALGIIYRLDNNGQYYRFTIADDQSFWVGRNTGLLEEEIVEKQSSKFIKPVTDGNKLKVVCSGIKQEVYVNDQLLSTVTDNTSVRGEMGMAFSNFGTPTANYTFSDFILRAE